MDSNVSQICGHLIDEVDCNGLVVVDDNEVDGNQLDMLNEGEIPNEGVVGYVDNEEGCSGAVTTPNKDDGGTSVANDPFLNQEFETPKAADEFYNVYSLAAGFGVRKAKTNKSKKNLEVITRRFDLTSPTRRGMHHSHNKFVKNMVCKNLMEKISDHGVKPCNIARVCTSASGGGSGVTANQVVSHLRVRRRNNMRKEAFLISRQFHEKQAEDPNFYFAMEMDDIGNLRSMFCADSRARNAYLTFADVIVFDVTYKTNRFLMPFAPLTGVNHHGHSTLFECALLADEEEETFTWLFQQWLKCMFGVAPGCIITDMDVAMRNAIRNVFLKTRHRFCSWHIHRHLIEHCAGMRDSESDFCKDYNKWFYKREIPDC
ncbi:protein FAR1-RELATED SEQUENCE 7-like [Tasmannia lanceolata]|uniref:protein FAR1-RELATED SEQUENCE 7-like n=1 Tax=Tasmannia lanceolata TaxID=3420 RepID=UPI00406415E8